MIGESASGRPVIIGISSWTILERAGCRYSGGYVEDRLYAGDHCTLCDEPFGCGVPVVIDEGKLHSHLSCVMEAVAPACTMGNCSGIHFSDVPTFNTHLTMAHRVTLIPTRHCAWVPDFTRPLCLPGCDDDRHVTDCPNSIFNNPPVNLPADDLAGEGDEETFTCSRCGREFTERDAEGEDNYCQDESCEGLDGLPSLSLDFQQRPNGLLELLYLLTEPSERWLRLTAH